MKPYNIQIEWEYTQEEDSGGRRGETHQYLTIKTCSNGVANYMILETERWAIDEENIEDFINEIRSKWEQIKSGEYKGETIDGI